MKYVVYTIKNLGKLDIFFLLAAIGAALGALYFQNVAFPAGGTTGQQISVAVYVKSLPAHVSLQSQFSPIDSGDLALSVTVTGPTKQPDPWLLVIQCSPEPGHSNQQLTSLWSEGAASPQPVGHVLATSEVKTPWTGIFPCNTGLSRQGQTVSAVIEGEDINLSLPILEQNPVNESTFATAPLYAESAGPGSKEIKNLVEVQGTPGSPCPATSPSPEESQSSPPPDTTSAAASPSVTPASSAGSPSASPSTGSCYTPVLPKANFTKYSFPTSVVTTETLDKVNLTDERVDSMFPPGQIGSNTITWQGTAGLSPSISATNLPTAALQNRDAFWAGLLYGVTAALAVPFLQDLPKAWSNAKKDAEKAPRRASFGSLIIFVVVTIVATFIAAAFVPHFIIAMLVGLGFGGVALILFAWFAVPG